MSEPFRRRGRARDAEAARQSILDAAEGVFAEHGFDGARVDAIASKAGYNKSLIFQYFGDKLHLYAEVIRRADDQTREIQTQLFSSLIEDKFSLTAQKLRTLLKTFMSAYLDYLIENPRILRIYLWEMAEGWQTYARIVSQRDFDDIAELTPVLQQIQELGLLRSDYNPIFQVIAPIWFCVAYLALIPIYKTMLPEEDITSAAALSSAKEYVLEFVSHGLFVEPSEVRS